ncbi:helix-turn-helix transcriptional regulator [Mesorhizobium sp. M2D.F.Ca.ET.185.01.1.1]|nr:helix-turn-helix transcriptional regulator [Mesorhizobium sp. M2D.F.Ca.ET.140.01.1.1]TGP13291.1 helix-turn-helix transcriptional regulator [Mesorhizobium sp. M2D.F.Ca.ET.233.01.1.1]TGP27650.1 helix-turn-helix transcriptional regulator [Mesorhizobium sp. M2D.F.Ca.ET.232.01.1.1]TGP44358.1 helix-turn-helix transcriptional regulator [bacterium M00.F.Ca.ET.230.01.1.1]TGP51478.1 helix-turn-helix transcriptional regulator [Mesorhizobium sp. M2D.F.Ca.ET.226.01.1.1]TGP60708.1 helix-turn-helix transc
MSFIDRRNDSVASKQHMELGTAYGASVRRAAHCMPDRQGTACASKRRSMESVTGMLDRIGCGFLVLNREKRVLEWNTAAQSTFERQGDAAGTAPELTAALRRLVANVPTNFLPGSLSWVVIRSTDDRPVVLNEGGVITPDGTSIVALLDRENRSSANPQTLQKMFGLTSAETQLAMRLAQGDAPLEIARSWRLSRTTIRSQLASLFAKTETKRQGELVALLGRISVLP